MLKNKQVNHFAAVVDDVQSGPFSELQGRLDEIQDNGMTALTMRSILFNKMLDLHNVPDDHFLRNESTAKKLDDPSVLVEKLNNLGFVRKQKQNGVIH
ncbi:hypothetical protein PSECIP111951_01050 [Pseudoalteromonas holothuriae]|uniref:Uncharacterized protein n=1 Tax=Pseudoalteromonas holothuriae TaxID=2963714 RepID=A0A9W4QX57_9GAMM|nr:MULTISPECIES: hypothetical protein [unclassified Pseudoalteromonas]CAH9054508.1 hypothetical protein PSECIP111951_01050 [Pseudoalteromonas sp. CIP111951]CAH9057189.1 hypothetical protein PSECIP111854_01946 [Pseudoalteromonas sp. CIP111854]